MPSAVPQVCATINLLVGTMTGHANDQLELLDVR